MELGASFGAKYATVMGADEDWSRPARQLHQDLRPRQAVRPDLLARFAVIRPLATLPQTVRLLKKRSATR
jgi:hypothetical protein